MNIFKILKTIFSFAISFVSFANVWRRPGQDDAFPKSRLAPSLVGSPPEATTPKIVVLHFDISILIFVMKIVKIGTSVVLSSPEAT